ncbi:SDR family oxidoreductase [Vibrio chagasii]|nr:SDR family oxidoreductase [Vibrio chagasii]
MKRVCEDNIRFNIVSPGTIDTAFHDGKSDELKSTIAICVPILGRFGNIEEWHRLVLSLHRTHAAALSAGQILDVNGGQIRLSLSR